MHWARELYLKEQISLYLEKTDNMMADDKSKAVERHKMIKCRSFQLNAHAMNE